MRPLRQVDENKHLAKVEVQLLRRQSGLGLKLDPSNGQLLTQLRVSSTVLLRREFAFCSTALRSIVCVGAICAWATAKSEKAFSIHMVSRFRVKGNADCGSFLSQGLGMHKFMRSANTGVWKQENCRFGADEDLHAPANNLIVTTAILHHCYHTMRCN